MRGREIVDMDVVAHRGAVGRLVIFPEDREIRHMPLQCHQRARDQVRFGSRSSPMVPEASAPQALK